MTIANANLIRIRADGIKFDYLGDFTYTNSGDVRGTLTAIQVTEGRDLVYSITGINRDAADFASLLNSGNVNRLASFLLSGRDRLEFSGGDDQFIGFAGDDTLLGRRGDDTLQGGAGDDRLIGNAGADRLLGGAQDDTLFGGGG
ncbi:MAG: hypothetical protein AAFU55_15715, partial [Pseudomonadota bacterium]